MMTDSIESETIVENIQTETHTMNSSELYNSSFQFTVEKFDDKNYKEWAQSITLVIKGKVKWDA